MEDFADKPDDWNKPLNDLVNEDRKKHREDYSRSQGKESRPFFMRNKSGEDEREMSKEIQDY